MYPVQQERQCRTVSSRQLHRRVSANSDLVQRLERQRVLDGHAGCVNTAVRGLEMVWIPTTSWWTCCVHYHFAENRYSTHQPVYMHGVCLANMTCMPKGPHSMLQHDISSSATACTVVDNHSTASGSSDQQRLQKLTQHSATTRHPYMYAMLQQRAVLSWVHVAAVLYSLWLGPAVGIRRPQGRQPSCTRACLTAEPLRFN